jgi:putative transposase
MQNKLGQVIQHCVTWLEVRFKQWTQPAKTSQVASALTDLTRSKSDLIAENMFLRQQLIVLERQVTRPQVKPRDRQILMLLASRIREWRAALVIVKPETVVRWHRQGFKLFWRRKSQRGLGRPPIAAETIALIEEMAMSNRTWRTKRIQGELLKLGIKINKGTVKKYMRRARRGLPPVKRGQTWATFISNHVDEIWSCDFVQTYDLLFRTVFVYFIVELGSRRVVHYGVTRAPSDVWVAQQVREATPYDERPRFLIRDNDSKYGQTFTRVAKDRRIDVLRTPIRAAKANAVCERFIGSVRRECLDHMIVLSDRHLQRLIGEYVAFFNHARPHQGIGQRIPDPPEDAQCMARTGSARVVGYPVLGGLHHDYRRVA